MIVQVIQYLRPDGRQHKVELEIPDEYQQQYDLIHACGCWLSCEQMMDGKAVQYITHAVSDFVIEITPAYDKEAAIKKLLQMIKSFDKIKFDEWLTRIYNRS